MKNLFLRTCNADGTSHNRFQWNLEIGGITESPDWNPEPECGGGLHGLLHGKGYGGYLNWNDDALWMVCDALGPIVDIDEKIKTSKAKTLFIGNRKGATDFLIASGCNPVEVVGAFIIGGDYSIVTGGNWSTVTGGDYSTVTGGVRSTVTGGAGSTVTGGVDSTVTGGDYSTVTGGVDSTVIGGVDSTVTGGDYSTVTGGAGSTVTGGVDSTVTGGDYSTVTGGAGSTVTGGVDSTVIGGVDSIITGEHGSALSIKWYDSFRPRITVAYVGEDGIEPNVPYKLDANRKFVRA
jgi:hypothetical protein